MTLDQITRPAPEPQVVIRDQGLQNRQVAELLLRLSSYKLTARDLIAERVRAECDRRLVDREGRFSTPLVQPTAEEAALNGEMPRAAKVNPERQVSRALEGFERNAFILLLDDRQVENLDDQVQLGPKTVVTFLRLTPLVGG